MISISYFKSTSGEVFAYDDSQIKSGYGKDMFPLSEEELQQHLSKYLTVGVDPSIHTERSWRDKELLRADIELYKVQDSDPKAVGSVAQWREYRKALRSYPESEGFPNKDKRPVAPDA